MYLAHTTRRTVGTWLETTAQKALETALAQHREAVRQGLGHAPRATNSRSRRGDPHRVHRARRGPRHRRPARAAASWRSTARSRRVRPRSRCTPWPTRSAPAASPPSSTPSTPSTPNTRGKLGVDTDALLVSQPDTGEQALEIADMLIRLRRARPHRHRLRRRARAPCRDRGRDGRQPRRPPGPPHVARRCGRSPVRLNQTKTTAIFINQLREKIGVFFGSPETTTGGKALKFYASVRLDVRRIETLKDGTDSVGNRTRVKVVKNKMAPPFKQRRIRHHVRPGHLPRGRPHRHGRGARPRSRSPAPGTPTTATSSARARRTPAASSRTTPTWPTSWRRRSSRSSASPRPSTATSTTTSPTSRSAWTASELRSGRAPQAPDGWPRGDVGAPSA